ncbi:MAG: HD domain-containing protein [Candidatus Heimdallarchaeota archaeon]
MFKENEWPFAKGKFGLPVWRLNRVLAIIQQRIQKLTEDDRELPITWSVMHMYSTMQLAKLVALKRPITWSVMHMYSTMQLAKLVALKRDLDPELAALTCAFHDVYSLFEGKTEDHGVKAEPFIKEIISEYNSKQREALSEITDEEKEQIIIAVKNHSDKNRTDDDPYGKLLKDVDSIDSYLHGTTPGRKSGRIPRSNEVLTEFSIEHHIEH